MKFSHVLITRPVQESQELASMLKPLGFEPIVQPPFHFSQRTLENLPAAGDPLLLIFTSPRSVEFGLPQLPQSLLSRGRVAAIGPSTARALESAGCRVDIRPASGYSSEALLAALKSVQHSQGRGVAMILAAPGGRETLAKTLTEKGWDVHMLWAYQREPAEIDEKTLAAIQAADSVLSIWTSANAMKSLSQRFPPAAWYRLCTGEWLVISERLQRLARAYGSSSIHLAQGPGNYDILAAVRSII